MLVCDPNCSFAPLPNFQSETFYGMGETAHGAAMGAYYHAPYQDDHDYVNMGGRVNLSALNNDPTFGPPNCSNTITWNHA